MTYQHVKTLERIHGTQHLLQRTAIGFKLETQSLAVSNEAVPTARQPVTVDLIAMSKSRLHYPITTIDLQHQSMNVGDELFIDFWQMCGDDSPKQ